jgi:hypothetical protein
VCPPRALLKRAFFDRVCPPRPPRHIRFSDYLKDLNRRGAAIGPVPFDEYLAARNRANVRRLPHGGSVMPAAQPVQPVRPRPPRPVPSEPADLWIRPRQEGGQFAAASPACLPPIPESRTERRVQIAYRVEIPSRPGRVIDVLT